MRSVLWYVWVNNEQEYNTKAFQLEVIALCHGGYISCCPWKGTKRCTWQNILLSQLIRVAATLLKNSMHKSSVNRSWKNDYSGCQQYVKHNPKWSLQVPKTQQTKFLFCIISQKNLKVFNLLWHYMEKHTTAINQMSGMTRRIEFVRSFFCPPANRLMHSSFQFL